MPAEERSPTSPPPPAARASQPEQRIWRPLDLIQWTKEYFSRKGVPAARLEAELLLAEVLHCERVKLYANFEMPVEQEALARFKALVKRRVETREPIQYILGHAQFLGLRIEVTPAVLIPRPETEELAEWAIVVLKGLPGDGPLSVLDLGTGSGCLALALAQATPRARVLALEIAPVALEVARANARRLQLEDRIEFLESDLFSALPPERSGAADLIVANPPYIDPALRTTLQVEVRDHEPAGALFAADAGRAVIRRIIVAAPRWRRPGGWLGVELSPEQAQWAAQTAAAAGFQRVEIRKDLAKKERILVAAAPPPSNQAVL